MKQKSGGRIKSPVSCLLTPVSTELGDDGFEPSKRIAADLQSAPFDHSGNPPSVVSQGKTVTPHQ